MRKKRILLDEYQLAVSSRADSRLQSNIFTDFSGAYPQISGAGDFELTYAAVSENFPVVRGIFRLHIGTQLNDVKFTQINDYAE